MIRYRVRGVIKGFCALFLSYQELKPECHSGLDRGWCEVADEKESVQDQTQPTCKSHILSSEFVLLPACPVQDIKDAIKTFQILHCRSM